MDVPRWLEHHGVEVLRKKTVGGSTIYELAECPFDPSHNRGEAAIFVAADGKLGAKCHHDSCSDKTWRDFREAIGPIPFDCIDRDLPPRTKRGSYTARENFDLELVSNADLSADTSEVRFLVKEVLVQGQPGILGGTSKSLKTSIAVDLAISVASGEPFLGRWPVETPGPVLFVSAESGKTTLREVMRAVCRAKGIEPESLDLHWSFRRPQLANPAHLAALCDALETVRPQLVILDPTYLVVLSGMASEGANNLFKVGEILGQITDAIEGYGATLLLLHHVRKPQKGAKKIERLDLGDLAYAGFGEWARQWMFLTRLSDFEPGIWRHDLHLAFGGSAGHSGAGVVVIDEGRPVDELIGRRWKVEILTEREWEARADQGEDHARLADILRGQTRPETAAGLGKCFSPPWPAHRVRQALERLNGQVQTIHEKGSIFYYKKSP